MDESIARIIDANFNRAREALRVVEDYVRFVQDDPAGCELLKNYRHDFVAQIRRLPGEELVFARNTPGDVGTSLFTASERCRADAREVCTAALKRLPEALRTIEEYVKVVDPQIAAAIESLRYRGYDLEQRVLMRGELSARMAGVRLYVLVTASMCSGNWLKTAEAVIDGGADCLQLREKSIDDGELLQRAKAMADLCRRRGVLFILNDRPDLARLAQADGVHLGQTDVSVAQARQILGPDRLIGVSTHNPGQFRAAVASRPDYIAVGPMFPSSTKPQDHVPGPDLLTLAMRETQIPIVPIGGIVEGNLEVLMQAGARRVCVCSAVISSPDPAGAARRLMVNGSGGRSA